MGRARATRGPKGDRSLGVHANWCSLESVEKDIYPDHGKVSMSASTRSSSRATEVLTRMLHSISVSPYEVEREQEMGRDQGSPTYGKVALPLPPQEGERVGVRGRQSVRCVHPYPCEVLSGG